MKIVFFLILVFAISGLFTIGFSDVSATHNDNGKGEAKGCTKGSAADKGNNPHCGESISSSDQLTTCDIDGDGIIDQSELEALGLVPLAAAFMINDVSDGTIDTDQEVRKLNRSLQAINQECAL